MHRATNGLFLLLCLPIVGLSAVQADDDHVHAKARFRDRWITTVSNPVPLQQGDPTTLTWAIVPDGTPIIPRRENESDDPSNLIATMDRLHGDDWRQIFHDVFNRYSDLSGLSYVPELKDDQAAIRKEGFVVGQPGVRADIRIGGHKVDDGNQFGYNHFPQNGDMVLDTSDSFLEVRSRIFNLVAHEHGHGLGLEHVHSRDSRPLMLPFIAQDFQGPQFDDILSLHRGYGDWWEKNGGNDEISNAVHLGTYRSGDSLLVGDDAVGTRVTMSQTDFVSIDGISDIDYFSFSLDSTATTSIVLTPAGPTYHRGSDAVSQERFDASSQNDLTLQVFRNGSQFPLAQSAKTGVGGTESIENILLGAGTYQVRISGSHDSAQMYRLRIGEESAMLAGDFDEDGVLDVDDIELLSSVVRSNEFESVFDLNSDDVISEFDRRFWVHELKRTYFGDANLDGEFNSTDFVQVFAAGEYEDSVPGNSTWATGDWNGDGDFGTVDLITAFQDAGFEKGKRLTFAVPEPTSSLRLVIPFLFAFLRKKTS